MLAEPVKEVFRLRITDRSGRRRSGPRVARPSLRYRWLHWLALALAAAMVLTLIVPSLYLAGVR